MSDDICAHGTSEAELSAGTQSDSGNEDIHEMRHKHQTKPKNSGGAETKSVKSPQSLFGGGVIGSPKGDEMVDVETVTRPNIGGGIALM